MATQLMNQARGLVDFFKLGTRINRRAASWAKEYRTYLASDSENAEPPLPAVVQIVPTERCNLRCPMCNQWGDTGYFLTGKRPVSSMAIDDLTGFLDRMRALQPEFILSVHGGEPFMYREMPALLDYIAQSKVDTFFTTNGTLLGRHAERLARINRHTFYLLSIDGDEQANDKVRGEGTFKKIMESAQQLQEACQKRGTGVPKIIVSYCLTEFNPESVDGIMEVGRKLGAFIVNYNFRWFLPEEKGKQYNEILRKEFKVEPTNAWTGWVTGNGFEPIDPAIDRIYDAKKKRGVVSRALPPYGMTVPRLLSRMQAKLYYKDHDETFGIRSCIMPSYWVRVHSSGDMIYCPGHPDVIAGNVFKDDFKKVYMSQPSIQLRKYVEKKLLPICNRCCGLFMTHPATQILGEGYRPTRAADA